MRHIGGRAGAWVAAQGVDPNPGRDWRQCERCVGNAEELRVVGPDHRNFSPDECPECGHVTTEADLVDFDAVLEAFHAA